MQLKEEDLHSWWTLNLQMQKHESNWKFKLIIFNTALISLIALCRPAIPGIQWLVLCAAWILGGEHKFQFELLNFWIFKYLGILPKCYSIKARFRFTWEWTWEKCKWKLLEIRKKLHFKQQQQQKRGFLGGMGKDKVVTSFQVPKILMQKICCFADFLPKIRPPPCINLTQSSLAIFAKLCRPYSLKSEHAHSCKHVTCCSSCPCCNGVSYAKACSSARLSWLPTLTALTLLLLKSCAYGEEQFSMYST